MEKRNSSLLFDLQSLQNGSRTRGIGRYTREHLGALLTLQDMPLELHGAVDLTYGDQAQTVLSELSDVMPADRLHGYRYPTGLWSAYPVKEAGTVFTEELVRLHVEAMAPDIVHVPSLFEGAVEPCSGLGRIARARGSLTSCLVHDVIPLVMPEQYLVTPQISDWYQHKLNQLREFDVLLANSHASKRDVVNLMEVDPDRIHVVHAGYPEVFQVPQDLGAARGRLEKRFGLTARYVLYTGNSDYRKNTRGAIQGFAGVPSAMRKGMVLVLNQTEGSKELLRFAQECGLAANSVLMTGYVTDAELVDLYACCETFVFPSLYEGFGLPVVEAMACGAPVLVGDNSSLKEIVELDDARFDASEPSAISAALQRVLTDEDWRGNLRGYGLERVREYSWKRTAQLSVEAWEIALDASRSTRRKMNGKSKVAMVVPALSQDESSREWVEQLSARSRDMSLELASPNPVNWPSYMQVQQFPEDRLPVDGDVDMVVVIHANDRTGVLSGLAFPGGHVDTVRSSWGALRDLMAETAIPEADFSLPELLAECLGVLEAPQDHGALSQVLAPMFRRKPVVTSVEAADPADVLHWLESIRTRYECLASAQVAALLKPCLPAQARGMAGSIRHALESVGNFGAARRVLIDMSELAKVDYGTGIQRVVRNLVRELCARNEEGRILFVPVYHEGAMLKSAHLLVEKTLGIKCPVYDEDEGVRSRDMLFLADSAWVGPERFLPSIEKIRENGGEVAVFFHDIIPLRFPETCGDGMPQAFRAWTEFAVRHADLFVCNSRTTAEDLELWIEEFKPSRRVGQRFGYVHLGSEVVEQVVESRIRPELQALFASAAPTFVAVGTLEPRKDHATIIKAFEKAWADGVQANLLLIGKMGWGVDRLVAQIKSHPELGKRLFWPEKVTNAELDLAYRSARGVIQASVWEGFGLPLVEAARFGTPLLLSNIAIFREIAGDDARYFPVRGYEELAELLMSASEANLGSRGLIERVLSWREYGRLMRGLLLSDLDSSHAADAWKSID